MTLNALYIDFNSYFASVEQQLLPQLRGSQQQPEKAIKLATQVKQKIAYQFEWIRCSIGIAPNTFLAKVASNMQKPDGCVLLDMQDIPAKLLNLALRDLNGIGKQMEVRLNRHKIFTVVDLYHANRQQLQAAWGSVEGERMYDKLRGLEPHYVHRARSSLGHSHVLPPEQRDFDGAKAVLHRLLQKACMRLRSYELLATRISVKIKCRGPHYERLPSWQLESEISATDNTLRMIEALERFLQHYPQNIVPYAVGISLSGLLTAEEAARDLFQVKPLENEQKLNKAIDQLNLKFGKNTVYFGGAHGALKDAPMRIAFNHIPDLKTESDH